MSPSHPEQNGQRQRRQLLLGSFVHCKGPTDLEFMHNTAVAVDEHGKIAGIEKYSSSVEDAQSKLIGLLDWSADQVDVFTSEPGQFFFPGFIDSHVHASQYPNVGIFGKSTLLDWLETYTFPLESSLKDLAKARRVYSACVRKTLSHGTTTAAYYATIDVAATNLLADICLALGQRAFVGRVCMDNPDFCPDYYMDESPEESISATRKVIEYIKTVDPNFDLVSPIITPRFAPTCSNKAMSGLAELQRETNLPVQTHIDENKGEIELVKSLFPESTSYADVYDRNGLLTPKTILAHAVHLSEDEARLISQRGAKVSHCACSNSALTSGVARIRWLWSHGIDVGLGSDMSGGYSPSILEAARQAALVSRHLAMDGSGPGAEGDKAKLTVEEALFLATRGGARCVGLEDRVGGFEVGMDWDAQLIGMGGVDADGSHEGGFEEGNVDVFGWENWDERIAKWLYGGDDRNTKMVWVKGRLVHARR